MNKRKVPITAALERRTCHLVLVLMPDKEFSRLRIVNIEIRSAYKIFITNFLFGRPKYKMED